MNWIDKKQVFEATDYRGLVNSWISHLKLNSRYFSMRSLSTKCGFSAPNYFQLLLLRKRNLGFEGLTKLSKSMGFSGLEKEYFQALVRFNDAPNAADKQNSFEQLIRIRNKAVTANDFKISITDYDYLCNWLHVAIREAVLTHPYLKSYQEISNLLWMKVPDYEIKASLHFLEKAGFLKKTPSGYLAIHQNLVSNDEIRSVAIRRFHDQILDLGKKALYELDVSEREFGSLTLSLTASQFKDLKVMIKEFRSELHEKFSQSSVGAHVHQLSIILFPLTKNKKSKDIPQ